MTVAYPLLLIAIGLAVLLLGKRLAVLGAAVGAIQALAGHQDLVFALAVPLARGGVAEDALPDLRVADEVSDAHVRS